MEVNAHGEVTRKYRKAAMLDRELTRGTEEERALQEAFEAKEARQRAAERRADGACKAAEALRAEIGKAEGARKASAALAEVVG